MQMFVRLFIVFYILFFFVICKYNLRYYHCGDFDQISRTEAIENINSTPEVYTLN